MLSCSWIVVAMMRGKVARGSVHPVLLSGGVAVLVEQGLEVIAFDAPWWRAAAQPPYGWLHE